MIFLLPLIVISGLLLSSLAESRRQEVATPSSWRRVSLAVLAAHLLINRIRVDVRQSDAIFDSGLSTQNRSQAVVTVLLVLWAFVLVTSGRVRAADVVGGQRLWVSLLFTVFLFSAAWSVTPDLTAYRSIELLGIWLLTLHVCRGIDCIRLLGRYIEVAILAIFIDAWLNQTSLNILRPAGLRENTGGLLAGCYIILIVCLPSSRVIASRMSKTVALIAAIYCLIVFNSLAAVLSLAIGFLTFAIARIDNRSIRRLVGIATLSVAGLLVVLPVSLVNSTGGLAADIFNRDVESVLSGTGRLQLWSIALEESRAHPLGLGLTADRSLRQRAAYSVLNWPAASAHNGYVSALIGLGGLGLVLVLAIAFGTFRHSMGFPRRERHALHAFLAVYWSNNMSISLFGAWSSAPTILPLIVLAGWCSVVKRGESPDAGAGRLSEVGDLQDDSGSAVPRQRRNH